MKSLKPVLAVLALAAGALASGAALAHGRVVFGFNFGFPVYPAPYSYYYYPAPVYYPAPPPVYYPAPAVQSPPTVYSERQDMAPASDTPPSDTQQSYWYYCSASAAYYPYAKQCPGGWQRVAPRPPG